MKKLIVLGLGVYTLAAASPVSAQLLCKDLVNRMSAPVLSFQEKRLVSMGENLTNNTQFMERLKTAIADLKKSDTVWGKSIDADKSVSDLITQIKNLTDPTLAGMIVDLFSSADRLTYEYAINQLTSLKQLPDGSITMQLKGADAYYIAQSIKQLNSRHYELQADAYFTYKLNGNLNRPTLPKINDYVKSSALSFIERNKSNLANADVKYAIEVLAKLPVVDSKIDNVLRNLLDTTAADFNLLPSTHESNLAQVELLMLDRNIAKLSTFNLDFSHAQKALAEPKANNIYLRHLLAFHAKNNLRNFPVLKNLAREYFKTHPDLIKDLADSDFKTNLQKFINDFGPGKSAIDSRAEAITSPEKLAQFIMQVANYHPSNFNMALELATHLYSGLSQAEIQKMARTLMQVTHEVSDDIIGEMNRNMNLDIKYKKPEYAGKGNPKELIKLLPTPIDAKEAARLTNLAEDMKINSKFMSTLQQAIKELTDKENGPRGYNETFSAKRSLNDLIKGVEALRDPLLTGKFIDLITKADAMTAQWIVVIATDNVVVPDSKEYAKTVQLRTTLDMGRKRSTAEKVFEILVSRPVREYQEEAYFLYEIGVKQIGSLDVNYAKDLGLSYLERVKTAEYKDYDSSTKDYYITTILEVLGRLPVASAEIDRALTEKLNTEVKYKEESSYQKIELMMLERNALGLSSFKIEFKHTLNVLSEKKVYEGRILEVVALHAKYDLRKTPLAQAIVTALKNDPKLFTEIETHIRLFEDKFSVDIKKTWTQFRSDMGI